MNILEKNAPPAEELPPEEGADDDMSEGNPEYQQAKEMLLSKLYEEGAAEQIAQALAAAPDPVQGLIDQSMALIDAMEQATQGAVPDELVMSFVIELVQELVDIAEGAKLKVSTQDVAVVTREVIANVIDNLGGDSSDIREEMGAIDPAEVAEAMEG